MASLCLDKMIGYVIIWSNLLYLVPVFRYMLGAVERVWGVVLLRPQHSDPS